MKVGIFSRSMGMSVQKDGAFVLSVPHQDGIVTENQFVGGSSDAVGDFFVVADLVE